MASAPSAIAWCMAAPSIAVRTRVGHAFIKPAMREQQAVFAAELSGHYYYADLHYTDNGLRTLIELINLVSAGDEPLSEMLAPFQTYYTSGETNRQVPDRDRVLKALEAEYQDGQIDHLDGLSVDYADWWFNARASHTEPVLRFNIGASSQTRLDKERKALLSKLDRIIEKSGQGSAEASMEEKELIHDSSSRTGNWRRKRGETP